MSILKKNINMKGSAFPSKCNNNSNYRTQRYMHGAGENDNNKNIFYQNDLEIFKFYLIERNYKLLWDKNPERLIQMVLSGTLNFNHINFLMLNFLISKFKNFNHIGLSSNSDAKDLRVQISEMLPFLENSMIKVRQLEQHLIKTFSETKAKKIINNIPITILLDIYENYYLKHKKFPKWILDLIKNS